MTLADPNNSASSSLPAGHPFLNIFTQSVKLTNGMTVNNALGQLYAIDLYPGSTLGAAVSFLELQGAGGQSSGASVGGTIGSRGWCVRSASGSSFGG